jgi:hypothetical protein
MMFSARFKHYNPSRGAPEYHQIRDFHDFGDLSWAALSCSPIILPIRTKFANPPHFGWSEKIFSEKNFQNFSKSHIHPPSYALTPNMKGNG